MKRPDSSDHLQVGPSAIHGSGLFAAEPLTEGVLIGTYDGPAVDEDGMHVLWVEEEPDHWVGYDGRNCLRYMNHSATPNAEMDGRECYALRDIDSGEEITIDYGWDDEA
ncbi:SET domain-containing protein [Elongatibacter sediminis]|uniref:SET domain-containing protein n=1 Tax=Elongatibacter sediminis TaxID=3119006 RepID=A0AAW9RFE5_9GAMM